jgi:hypothetical protein
VSAADPTWISAPGLAHLPIDGHPHAGEAFTLNGRAREVLSLGTIGGRELLIEAESLEYLDELDRELTFARSRLAMFLPLPVHPFGEDGAAV